jgi:hypothetical protein
MLPCSPGCHSLCAQAAYKVGDIKKAQRIQERLMTDDEKRAKGLIK